MELTAAISVQIVRYWPLSFPVGPYTRMARNHEPTIDSKNAGLSSGETPDTLLPPRVFVLVGGLA